MKTEGGDSGGMGMEMGGKMEGKSSMVNPTLRRTATCSSIPEFSLVDYSTDPTLHGTTHGLVLNEDADVLMVGLYFAD